jgi:hypothetical protein
MVEKKNTADRWLQDYRIRKSLVRSYTALTIISLLCLLGSAGWALYAWYFAYMNYGPAAIWNWIKNPLLLSALLFPLLLLFLTQWNRLSQIRVRTHTRGLQIQRKQKRFNIPWDSIQEIYTSATHYGINGFIWKKKASIRLINTTAHKDVSLDADIDSFDSLVNYIKASAFPRIGAEIDMLLKSNQPVHFGFIQLSNQWISVFETTIMWEDIDSCTLNNGRLVLKYLRENRERTFKLRSARIPNFDLCYEIIRKMSGD